MVAPPTAPLFPRAATPGGTFIDLSWEPPESDGHSPIARYEICVVTPDGTTQPFEPTDGPVRTWRIRGLALNHTYRFRVRAVNSAGAGIPSGLISATPIALAVFEPPPGPLIPLIDTLRQSLIVRLDGVECRVHVWWQPTDQAWYASLEAPVNTYVARGRRLVVNGGLLDRVAGVVAGNVVCRAIGADDSSLDPGRDAWARNTHGLIWEAT